MGKHTQEETKNQTRFWRKNEKKGEKGAPTPAQMKRAKGEEVDDLDERSVLKRDKKLPNLMVRKKGKAESLSLTEKQELEMLEEGDLLPHSITLNN